jgi:hypothetical protein
MSAAPKGKKIAILACLMVLVGALWAVGPAGAAAGGRTSCGSKEIAIREGGKTLQAAASRISVSGGATCKQAVTVIRGVLLKEVPKGWKVKTGGFKVPRGLVAQQAVNGKKTIRFATVGP